jgi:hypothetical protein
VPALLNETIHQIVEGFTVFIRHVFIIIFSFTIIVNALQGHYHSAMKNKRWKIVVFYILVVEIFFFIEMRHVKLFALMRFFERFFR